MFKNSIDSFLRSSKEDSSSNSCSIALSDSNSVLSLDASKDLILEINSFTKPSPINLVSIQTYIADFFAQNNLNDDLISNELHPFQVNVLDLKRTITEKVAAIAGASSRQPDDHSELKNKIRHLSFDHIQQIFESLVEYCFRLRFR